MRGGHKHSQRQQKYNNPKVSYIINKILSIMHEMIDNRIKKIILVKARKDKLVTERFNFLFQ